MSDARELLREAQAAELRGDKAEAVRLLRRAAEVYRDKKLGTKALKLLRHVRRLEGVEEKEVDPDDVPEVPAPPVMPIETQEFVGPKEPRVMPERGPVLADPTADAWCSFCCKPQKEVGRLIAAPTGTFICAACIKAAKEMLG